MTTEALLHAGIRGRLWFDRDQAVYVVRIDEHDIAFEAKTYQQAMSQFEETAATLAERE